MQRTSDCRELSLGVQDLFAGFLSLACSPLNTLASPSDPGTVLIQADGVGVDLDSVDARSEIGPLSQVHQVSFGAGAGAG